VPVPRSSPFIVALSDVDRALLEQRASSRTVAHRDVVRARIVLLAADGVSNVEIARRVGVCVDVASKWRKRFCEEGRPGLSDRKRSGRPRHFSGEVVAGIKAMACEPPERREVPLTRWSSHELAAQAVTEGLVEAISSSTVRRWLHAAAIKPWRYRSWIFPRDPRFAEKAARVLDLYERLFEGRPLEEDECVISADEKSQLQALSRRHRDLESAPGRLRRVEFEYRRGGTLAYLGAYDVHRAVLFGEVADKTGIKPFMDLVAKVMSTEPYKSARRVYFVVDNGSSHNGKRSIERLENAFPNARLIHLPIHASWLNQIEVVFSIIQRKVVRSGDFADLAALAGRLEAFEDHYNATATPFDWRFNKKDLAALLERLELRTPLAA
jgi:transposase